MPVAKKLPRVIRFGCHDTRRNLPAASARKRRGDGAEIFTLKKQRHAEYWMAQAFPVLLVIRNSEGEVQIGRAHV